ncbi:RNase3 domain-containing protein [Xylaria nigripes]|nr:RNase3 domain-containing protein [Xylaria nigripes]
MKEAGARKRQAESAVCLPAAEMSSAMQGVTSSMDEDGSWTAQSDDDSNSQVSQHQELDKEAYTTTSVGEDMSIQGTTTVAPTDENTVIHARAYQIEMFEKSLEQNIIVVMDTGSGKTQVAVLRIQDELKKQSNKITWFLAPTVALCEQQYRVIKSQTGAAQVKFVKGTDNVHTWSSTRIWDEFLKNARVVVSTYQILCDAISHGFVNIGRLGLIIFDEAHNCTGRHPGSKIMEHYRIHKECSLPCPAILGLTASPIMRSSLDSMDKIEQTLDAVCKTPTTHREELMRISNRPALLCVPIQASMASLPTDTMTDLGRAFRSLDILKDPYILHLQRAGTERSLHKALKCVERRDTPTIKQIQSLYRKSTQLQMELGSWAADNFIYQCIAQLLDSHHSGSGWSDTWNMADKQYLIDILRQVDVQTPLPLESTSLHDRSNKFNTLVRELQSVPDGTRCIIFVLETATVAVLAQMLSATTSVSSRFRIGTMIGTSNYPGRRRDFTELNEMNGNLDLENFRAGKLDLLIATSVADEGIDVPSCDLVISFNAPANLKSFIQRRGRARMEHSKFILLVGESSEQHQTWQTLEEMMRRRYEDDARVAQEIAELEEMDPDPDVAPLRIPSTGAQLDFDQAKSHLGHFCQKITSGQYIDHQPYYIAEEHNESPYKPPTFSAVVHLPSSLPPHLRRVRSVMRWSSEKNAFKDAAFQAFKAIYEAGLVNDNLMPLIDDDMEDIEARTPMIEVKSSWKPWERIAQQWRDSKEVMQRELLLKDGNRVIARFEASLPCHFPRLPTSNVYWDSETTWTIETSEDFRLIPTCDLKEDQSAALIDLAYGHRWPVENLPHILHLQSTGTIAFREHVGQQAAIDHAPDPEFLVRDMERHPYICLGYLPSKPLPEQVKYISPNYEHDPVDEPWLALAKWSRRSKNRDFLHPTKDGPPKKNGPYQTAIPAARCTLDTINVSKVCFGRLIPSILHMLEVQLITEELCNTALKDVSFSNHSLVRTAISSRAAQESTDYERLEFLGDSTLKIMATLSVMIQHPYYPEGYLSFKKDRIVSNSRLYRASIDKGMDRIILTRRFNGTKWHPLYIRDFRSGEEEETATTERQMSTKTLADVVESLIGASFIDGGLSKALACLRTFLPEVEWHSFSEAQEILYNYRNMVTELPPDCEPLEDLIGHRFRNKSLLMESISHGCLGLYTETSMERLEFLGDSILDTIIVSFLWKREPELTNHQMHLLKTVSVNADLLGFLMMEWHTTQETVSIPPHDQSVMLTQERLPFWKFMRHRSYEVSRVQQNAESRYTAEREGIMNLFMEGTSHPWAELAHLDLPKFFSDMFESVLGAVWVDSGSLEACTQIVERVGILPYLRHIISDNVEIRHPKNKLGELAGRERKKVRYETERVRGEDGERDLLCRAFVDDELVVEVNGGVNEEEVVTKAAEEAYHILLRGRTKRIRTK